MITISAPAPRSDAELLAAHVAGDRLAFAELYLRHVDRLSRFATLRCASAEDAADALQEAMLAAHRGAPVFRHQAAVTSWLYRIVSNACIDRHRSNASQPRPSGTDEWRHAAVDSREQVDTAIVVRAALLRLPAAQRAAVLAVDLHGHSISEASRLLGVPEGTVKSRRSRARAALSRMLGPSLESACATAGH
ncbi:RNA polymerase sigma factor SigM [Mycobacterium sp. ACS4331]|uniref:RNA polymerase sigma factor SigM n=1 Tax=Mycobacterium sp. ACS4331 TaxID=1834121 RepID=UPI0007FBDC0D|nr:RNA polymerase sigma factor SigM [Mycobacterium sp. ACS4331]OBF23101.1 RNA polymerase sigma factor SigM [Mycobacterium sp. ACS4331]